MQGCLKLTVSACRCRGMCDLRMKKIQPQRVRNPMTPSIHTRSSLQQPHRYDKKGCGSNSDSHGDAAVAATVENKAGDVILMMTVANSKIHVTPYFRKACSLLGVTTPGRLKQLFAIVRHKPLAHKESKLAEASP